MMKAIQLTLQPKEKYVAYVEGVGYIAFSKFTQVMGTILLFAAAPETQAIKDKGKEGEIVAAFPVESEWVIMLRDRVEGL